MFALMGFRPAVGEGNVVGRDVSREAADLPRLDLGEAHRAKNGTRAHANEWIGSYARRTSRGVRPRHFGDKPAPPPT